VFQRSARAQDFAWVRSSENFLDEIWRYCLSDSPKDQALDSLLYWPVPVYGDSNVHPSGVPTHLFYHPVLPLTTSLSVSRTLNAWEPAN
jgi:hypothetical protein